jgi:hypothetical protein
MPAFNPRLRQLIGIYSTHYLGIGKAERKILLRAAETYDAWFLRDFIPWLEKQLTIKAGRWQMDELSIAAIPAAGKRLRDTAASILVRTAVEYSATYFKQFWRDGYKLAALNLEMQEMPAPRKWSGDPAGIVLSDPENMEIAGYVQGESSAWRDHLERHVRHMERQIRTACSRGLTTAAFRASALAPDGHVVGFAYGAPQGLSKGGRSGIARYSWYELTRRFVVSRPRIMAQSCAVYKLMREKRAGAVGGNT